LVFLGTQMLLGTPISVPEQARGLNQIRKIDKRKFP